MDKEKELHDRDWLILTQAKGIGPAFGQRLLAEYLSPKKIFETDSAQLAKLGLSSKSIKSLHAPDLGKIDPVLEWLQQPDHHLITCYDLDYPKLLKSIYAAPLILFAVGQRDIMNGLNFAIVGSRNPSDTGRKLAEEFAYELARSGLTICSGLALGIDYHSHKGALKAGSPTIAVLGNGLDIIYPKQHKKIAYEIVETGLLISEYAPGTQPVAGNFPQRNRIISELSMGVLVVEAAKKSGSLITARYALDEGRDIFAIPGSINNPLAKGTHSLIKQGAKLVETINDILEELSPLTTVIDNDQSIHHHANDIYNLDAEYQMLLDKMGYDVVTVDELVNYSGLTANIVSSMLLVLELRGLIEAQYGGKYCRCL